MSLTIKVPERPDDPGLFLGKIIDGFGRDCKECFIWSYIISLLVIVAVNFMNGAVNTAAQSKPTFTLYHAANDRTKRRRIMVWRGCMW